jgi:hypothetical protein
VEIITVPGDYDRNGIVNASDYSVWRDSRGQTGGALPADGDMNGIVDQVDYGIWRANLGRSAAGGQSLSSGVPEPSVFTLIAAVLFPWLWKRCPT